MDTAMRDLEQIRERDEDGARRRTGMRALSAAAIVGVVFSAGLMTEQENDPAAMDIDPLAPLARAAAPASVAIGGEPSDDTVPPLVREELSFPSVLLDGDDRPEVAAALAAAAAEHEHLDPLGDHGRSQSSALPPALVSLPAAAAAGPSRDALAEAIRTDPLVHSTVSPAATGRLAPRGQEGKYTLQVISYRTAAEAHAFADALRAKGHEAYVVNADIPGRGIHFRVRIGPFDTQASAEAYRRDFEIKERMNTYVVKRDD